MGSEFSFSTKAEVEDFGDMDYLKKNDFGLAFGAGIHLPLGFNAGARYVLGFTDISDVSTERIKPYFSDLRGLDYFRQVDCFKEFSNRRNEAIIC